MTSQHDPQRRPTHPGAVLREEILPPLGLTQTELAKLLQVSRFSISDLLLEKRALSPAMAVRVASLLNTPPETWLLMQQALDLWELGQAAAQRNKVAPLPPERLAALAARQG
ncbi:MAG TPA: HigA family addiction module antitoxin [Telluria sp.]|jgi:addiction module HigA family antidote